MPFPYYISGEILFGHIDDGDIINVDSHGNSLMFSYIKRAKAEDKELSKS